jgi:hypothetical protein
MRNLLYTCAAVTVTLGIVSATLWLELRTARQELADMRSSAELPATAAAAPQVIPPPAVVAATALPEIPSPPQEAQPEVQVAVPVAVQVLPSAPIPSVSQLLIQPGSGVTAAARESALLQSQQTASARVSLWKDRLAIAGHPLTTEQHQALAAAAIAQLQRETEESLELAGTAQPTNMESVLQMREDSVHRQNDTNMRILAAMTPHLTAAQTQTLRAQFESGHNTRMATFRAEQEALRQFR